MIALDCETVVITIGLKCIGKANPLLVSGTSSLGVVSVFSVSFEGFEFSTRICMLKLSKEFSQLY